MRVRSVLPLAAAFAAGSVLCGLVAVADQPPAGPPPMQKKVESPLLKASVGEWAVTWSMESPEGKQSGKGKSRIALGIGDTAVLEDYASDMAGGFAGHAVMKVSDDGKTVTTWWFDTFSPEPIKLVGPLTDAQATGEGDCPGMGRMKIIWKKVEGGFDFDSTMDGKPFLAQQYRKPK